MSIQHYIQEGTKAYCKTRHSNVELLCTVVMCDNYNVKVKLPCAINGHTHDVVNITEIRCLPPEEELILPPTPPQKNPLNNPFRKMLENLRCIEDRKEVQEPVSKPPREVKSFLCGTITYDNVGCKCMLTPCECCISLPASISQGEIELLEGLSEEEKEAYKRLLK